jgi:hypothetical protein
MINSMIRLYHVNFHYSFTRALMFLGETIFKWKLKTNGQNIHQEIFPYKHFLIFYSLF